MFPFASSPDPFTKETDMSDLPYAISSEELDIMGLKLLVHNLNTGERVIDAASVEQFFAALGGPETLTPAEAMEIMRAVCK